jgi:hypothetical protein
MRPLIPLRRRTSTLAAILALSLSFAVSIPGCTVLGLVAGGTADAKRSSGGTELLPEVKVGTHVKLSLWSGEPIEGEFRGWTRDSTAQAAGRFTTLRGVTVWIATRDTQLAVPAESISHVEVRIVPVGMLTGLLVGLTIDALLLKSMKDSSGPSCRDVDLGPDYHPFGARTEPARGAAATP